MKRQVLYDCTYMRSLDQPNSERQKDGHQGWGGEKGEFMGTELILFGVMKISDGGDGNTTL